MSNKNPLLSDYIAITADGAVELAENKDGKFKRFWKQIAGYGEFVDPRGAGKKMVLDKAWGERIVDNFKNGPIKRVPTPVGHPQTSAELAERNKGWLVDAEAREDGLYGLIEIRKADAAEDIESGVLVDTSVAFDEQYTDKKTGKIFRDVLKHVGLVNDPYIKDMTEFQPALSDGNLATILFSDGGNNNNEEEIKMTLVKNDREFEVKVTYLEGEETKEAVIAAGAELEVPEDQAEAVTKLIAEAVAPEEEEEDEELSDEEKKAKELADREAAVAAKEKELSDKQAAADYERLLSEGKIVPAQKDAFIALSAQGSATVELSDGESKTVSVLLSELFEVAPKIALGEQGAGGEGGKGDDDVELSDEEKATAASLNISEDEMKATKKEELEKK